MKRILIIPATAILSVSCAHKHKAVVAVPQAPAHVESRPTVVQNPRSAGAASSGIASPGVTSPGATGRPPAGTKPSAAGPAIANSAAAPEPLRDMLTESERAAYAKAIDVELQAAAVNLSAYRSKRVNDERQADAAKVEQLIAQAREAKAGNDLVTARKLAGMASALSGALAK
jgi:hypothetical protein